MCAHTSANKPALIAVNTPGEVALFSGKINAEILLGALQKYS